MMHSFMLPSGDKEDLDTKKETSLVPGHANVSEPNRLEISVAHAAPPLV